MIQTRKHLERVDRAGTRGDSNRVDETLTARCHAVVSSPAVEALSVNMRGDRSSRRHSEKRPPKGGVCDRERGGQKINFVEVL